MNLLIQWWWMAGLYSMGAFLAFLLMPFLRKPVDEEYGIKLDRMYDRLFVEFTLGDEVDAAPDSFLTEEELLALRDKILEYEIPFVHLQLKMMYDHEKKSFGYYAPSSIIHKYLNVAARKYVLEYGCKQIYKDTEPSVQRTETSTTSGPFVSRPSKQFMEKEINQFHYLGNVYELPKEIKIQKKVSFSEYLRLRSDSPCTLETQSTKID